MALASDGPSATEDSSQLTATLETLIRDFNALKASTDASATQQIALNETVACLNEAIRTQERSLADMKESHAQEVHGLKQEIRVLKQSSPAATSAHQPPPQPSAGPAPPPRRSRNLVVCIDGTSNQFSTKNTNVVELYHRLIQDDTQLTFYNSGIGTYATPSWKSFHYYKQVLYNRIDLAIAWGFDDIVRSAFRWLSDNYEDGDKIYLFGFSRGAYQIRTLAAMIDSVGLIRKGNQDQIPFAYELYAEITFPISGEHTTSSASDEDSDSDDSDEISITKTNSMPTTTEPQQAQAQNAREMCRHFKETFSRKNVEIQFAGAWDTVSSVGLFRDKSLPGTMEGMQHVKYFRHALALHERRVKFLQENSRGGLGPTDEAVRSVSKGEPPHTKEVWFAGSHGDIGGGAIANLEMNQFGPSLRWMMFEAAIAGLRFTGAPQNWVDKAPVVHESLTWPWIPFEYLPFPRLSYKTKDSITYWPHRAETREIKSNQRIHASALESTLDFRARLPPGMSWDVLSEDMIEEDPYTNAKDLITAIELTLRTPGLTLGLLNVEALKIVVGTEPGRKSLRDIPEAESTLLLLMGRYPEPSEEAKVVADAALSAMNSDTIKGEQNPKKYTRSQLRPVLARAREVKRDEIVDLLEEAYAPAQVQRFEHPKELCGVAYMPEGDRIISGCEDRTVRVWDLKSGQVVGAPMTGHKDEVYCVAVSPDGTQVASGSDDNTVRLWNAVTGAVVAVLKGHDNAVRSVAFSPDGKRVASGSYDETIRVWDVASAKTVVGPIKAHSDSVFSVAYSPDGLRIASGADDETVRVWNAETGQELWQAEMELSVYSVAYSCDGTQVVAGCIDGSVRVLDAETGMPMFEPLTGHTNRVNSVAFSPDGTKLASGSYDNTVRLWDAETGAELDVLRGHRSTVWSVAFSPDGKHVASASTDETLRIWDATGEWKRW